jgi:hypothetical protein
LAEIAPKGVSGISISWYNIGTTNWEISGYTTAYLEKSNSLAEFLGYQSARNVMYSIPDFIVETFKSPLMT